MLYFEGDKKKKITVEFSFQLGNTSILDRLKGKTNAFPVVITFKS